MLPTLLYTETVWIFPNLYKFGIFCTIHHLRTTSKLSSIIRFILVRSNVVLQMCKAASEALRAAVNSDSALNNAHISKHLLMLSHDNTC